jgi:hypothetical protein
MRLPVIAAVLSLSPVCAAARQSAFSKPFGTLRSEVRVAEESDRQRYLSRPAAAERFDCGERKTVNRVCRWSLDYPTAVPPLFSVSQRTEGRLEFDFEVE